MTATAPMTVQEHLEMTNLIIRETAPVLMARAKLQQRYGKVAEIDGPMGTKMQDIVLPPCAARVDAELVQLECRIRQVIMREYGQLPEEYDPEDPTI